MSSDKKNNKKGSQENKKNKKKDSKDNKDNKKDLSERTVRPEHVIDPITMNMHADEFYAHVSAMFGGDRELIHSYLQKKGFGHKTVIPSSFDSMSANEKEAFCVKLSNLSTKWNRTGYVSGRHTAQEFMDNEQLRNAYINSVVIIKYFDGFNGPQFWKNVWARDMRGIVLLVNPETGVIKCVSKLERGAELVTGMVSRNGVEVQESRVSDLDPLQQETSRTLITGGAVDMRLTSKVDGSLVCITSYTGQMVGVIGALVDVFGSDFARLWAEQSLALSGGTRLIIPSTQGTAWEGGFMAPYMVTSMLCSSGICSREVLEEKKLFYMDAWTLYGKQWIERFMQLPFFDQMTEIQTFSFEAVCADRCGLFGDRPHNELAVAYTRDLLIFLGTTICDKWFYLPHHMIVQPSFEEPLWWNVRHSDQVDQMLDGIDRMIRGTMTKAEYLAMFPPQNPGFNPHSLEAIERVVIDFEGWVVATVAETSDPRHLEVMALLDVQFTRYSKIKTFAYYIAHKFREENIDQLVEISKTAGDIFPLARKIAKLLSGGSLSNALGQACVQVGKLFADQKTLVQELRTAFISSSAVAASEGRIVPKNPFAGLENRTPEVQRKIILNFKSNGPSFGTQYLAPIFRNAFPEMDPATPDLGAICTSLVNFLQPWDAEYPDRIDVLTPMSSELRGLITACVGTSLA